MHALVLATPIVPDPDGGADWKPTQGDPRWLWDLLGSALASAGFKTLPPGRGRPGVDSVPIVGRDRRFSYDVTYLNPIVICEVVEVRSFGDLLRGAPRDPQCEEAFAAIRDAVRSDARVREVLTFAGSRRDADAFVRSGMAQLDRALGIAPQRLTRYARRR